MQRKKNDTKKHKFLTFAQSARITLFRDFIANV